jgi:ribose 5-phosphate isomerase RpiB
LKEGQDVRSKINEIVFKCDDEQVKEKVIDALKNQKQEVIDSGKVIPVEDEVNGKIIF